MNRYQMLSVAQFYGEIARKYVQHNAEVFEIVWASRMAARAGFSYMSLVIKEVEKQEMERSHSARLARSVGAYTY